MATQHSFILDALSGRPLDVLEQCVPIEVTRGRDRAEGGGAQLPALKDAAGTAAGSKGQHAPHQLAGC